MNEQLIPEHLIQGADKILFITHLAIGDYTYMQTYFKALSQKYPHLKIDLWVDEVRRTWCFWRWKHLKKYSLYDWLEECPFIHKIYRETYSPFGYKQSVKQAQQEKYTLVVSFGVSGMKAHRYAQLARAIAPDGFIVGVKLPIKKFNVIKQHQYKKLNGFLSHKLQDFKGKHITDLYASWFENLFDLKVAESNRAPFIDVPTKWSMYAKLQFLKRGIDKKHKTFGKVFFINPFAKIDKRSWPMDHVADLITEIKHDDQWHDISFIINVLPEDYQRINNFLKKRSLNDVFLFTADTNFFQLPAIMSCCDLVVSVETSTIHLASALRVPVVALMRQKNPEWAPWNKQHSLIVTTQNRAQWVKDIPVASIVHAVKQFSQKYF